MTDYVLDSYPLLVFLQKQPGWEIVDQVMENARLSARPLLISAINWGEVYYSLIRYSGLATARIAIERLAQSAIEVVLPSMDHVLLAAEYKANGGIAYADCYAAALAVISGRTLVTGDPEFKRLESTGLRISWLPPNT